MNYFQAKLGMKASAQQSQILQKIKSCGGDAIQTSEGLCISAELSEPELIAMLRESGLAEGLTVSALNIEDPQVLESLSRDTQNFVSKCA